MFFLLLLAGQGYNKNNILTHIHADANRAYSYQMPVQRPDGILEMPTPVSYTFIGNVSLTLGHYSISCDSAVYYNNTFIAAKNVSISNGSDSVLTCAGLSLKEGDNYATLNNGIIKNVDILI